ncbi:MAG: TRAP transporter small permease [Pseudolabrys sp.]|nr:TRAP transporter small permease [Pseudolabrys sp.]MBV9954643.1 TRAP transporter small permease [Pseudolabrys sp.]
MARKVKKRTKIAPVLRQIVEGVAGLFLVLMFLSFMAQVVSRYVFNNPLGWTDEASVFFWVWGTLWGAAFVLREKNEIRFDIFYSALSEKTRARAAVITGICCIVLFAVSLPATYAYVAFLKVERSAYLGIRLDYLYAIYVIFAVATIARYVMIVYRGLRGTPPDIQIGGGSAL